MPSNEAETPALSRKPVENLVANMGMIRRLLMVGAVFVIVGYLLIGAALFFEFTQFHLAVDTFAAEQTEHSLAGGGPDRAGDAALIGSLAEINKWPSLLLWMKLGGVGHILVGVFVALVAIVRTLSMVPDRLGYEMERTSRAGAGASAGDASPADD